MRLPCGAPWTHPGAQLQFFTMSFAQPLVGMAITGMMLGLLFHPRVRAAYAPGEMKQKPRQDSDESLPVVERVRKE
jgi:hypothetical protein